MPLDNTILVRAGNMDEAATILTGDVTTPNTYKATVTNHIDIRLQNFRDGINMAYPPDAAAFNILFDNMVVAIDGYLNDDIPDNSTTSMVDSLAQIKQALVDYETANDLTYPCPQCGATSFITDDDGNHQFCPLSNGYTQTPVQYVADMSSIQYVPA